MEAVRSRLLSIFFRSRRVMNVDPVKTNSPGIERQTPEKKVHIAPPPLSVASGNAPKAEIARKENSPAPLLIPEHEVKVQLDTAEDDNYRLPSLRQAIGCAGAARAQRRAAPRHPPDPGIVATNCCERKRSTFRRGSGPGGEGRGEKQWE